MKYSKKTAFALGLLFVTSPIFAADNFMVRHISFQGLRQLTPTTALHYLPFHSGEEFTTQKSVQIITALYKTGFFSDVEMFRQNDTLVIRVQERPVISELTFSGNKTITDEKLSPVLKKLKFAVGAFYDPSVLNQLKQGLQSQYDNMGFHGVQINVIVKQLPRNRVSITVQVVEGKASKVSHINFTGDRAFKPQTLRAQMKMKTTGILSWFTEDNRYSEYGLEQDIQSIQTFYLNHGYLEFQVLGQDITTNPYSHGTDIVLHVSEGPIYHISGFEVQAPYGDDPGIKKIMSHLRVGEVFSRQEILDFSDAISNYYADKGFAFSKAQVVPRVDQQNHTVFLTFTMTKGERVSVRRIDFVGNDRTLDTVLRTRLMQMEGAPYSLGKVNDSKQELQMLSYIKDITVDTKPVVDDPDAVDLDYHIKEFNAGRASVNGGYSDIEGFMYGANIVEPNFLGTGQSVSVGFTRSELSAQYSINYVDPFYTVSGISRSINVYYNQTMPYKKFNLEPYTVNDFGGAISYGIPVSLHDAFNIGYGYDYISVSNIQQVMAPGATNNGPASPSVLQFLARNGTTFSQFNLLGGWSHVTLNRAIFPTAGNSQSINGTMGVKIINRSVAWYKVTYDGKWYFPLFSGFIFEPHANLGYGGGFGNGINSALPFYNNYYAGGIETVPGFAANALGPFNTNNPAGCNAPVNQYVCSRLGGNVLALGGLNLIFPNPFGERFRTAFFLDGGNVFDTYKAQYTPQQRILNPTLVPIPYESVSFSNMRVSAGIEFEWWSPMGPIDLSLGFPLVKKKSDDTQIFGFTFGASI